jgi:cytochrome P450
MDSEKPATSEAVAPLRGPKSLGLIATIKAIVDPKAILLDVAKDYGYTFTVPDKTNPAVITGDPAVIKAVLTADAELFDVPYQEMLAPFLGATSLILTSGPRHKKDRKLLAPAFHGARMKAYGSAIINATIETFDKLAQQDSHTPFVMMKQAQAVSLEVILSAVFGIDASEQRAQFREAVIALMDATSSPLIAALPALRRNFAGLGPWARFQRALKHFDKLLYELIAQRKASSEPREDILSVLLGARYDDGAPMTDQELRDQLHLLIFAGHDTTSTALAWAFYWIHQDPAVSEKLQAEVDSLGDSPAPEKITALPYLEAVCQETLRIRPIAGNIARKLKAPFVLNGHTIEANWVLSLSILLLHNREDLYPQPEEFRPQRFIDRTFSPYEFLAFGGGSRRCLGAALAQYEMKLVIATVLSRYSLKLIDSGPVKVQNRGLTLAPKGGIRMSLTRRNSAATSANT